jgi:hypothetical protein
MDIRLKLLGYLWCFVLLAGVAHAESSFDRELVVKTQERAAKVEQVLKQLLGAYANEDARDFLDYVSEDRFRQDYLTFTDALYQDFRTYEIHRVDYWVDRVVADHVKQFLYVKWEKRYETLDDARQLNETGYSRFVFDEVEGKYLLIELAGNDLFGASLPEWTEETPSIPGQEVTVSSTPAGQADLVMQSAVLAYGNYEFYITNQGTAAAPSSTLQMSDPATPLPSAIPGVVAVPSIAAGQTIYLAPKDAGGAAFQTYVLDSLNAVNESNEGNNTGPITINK